MAPIPKKSLPKRLSGLDPLLVPLVDKVLQVTPAELPSLMPAFNAPMPKSDLHHWIHVLNRFDLLLKAYLDGNSDSLIISAPTTTPALTSASTTTTATASTASTASTFLEPTEAVSKDAVVAILDMTRVLWDNCTSRTLYASFEHVMALLYSRDLDIVNAALLFLIRPPQRQSKPKAAKIALASAHDRLIVLASRWGSKEDALDLASLVKQLKSQSFGNGVDLEDRMLDEVDSAGLAKNVIGVFSFSFYWAGGGGVSASADHSDLSLASGSAASTPRVGPSTSIEQPSTPAPKSFKNNNNGFSTPSSAIGTPSVSFAPTATSEKKEGLISIHVPNVFESGLTEQEFVDWVVKEYNVPQEHLFSVVHRARCAYSQRVRSAREKLVAVRVLALCVAVSLLPEDACQSKFFLYEPELPQVLADIIGSPVGFGVSYDLQAAALYALESISRLKGKTMEVLNAVGASVNHGVTVSVTRRVITLLETGIESADFVEAFFSFLSQLVNSSMGGSMLVSSGIVQVIIKAFQVSRESQMKNVSRFVTFLDLMIYTFPNAFTAFTAANGVDLLVARIKNEVAACLEAKIKTGLATLNDISFVQVALLRSLLKYVMHMMQISGMADQLRNLIETSLPSSILVIFENCKFFGANVFGLAINIMSTFIHNEPASLPILQESKLPQTLLQLTFTGEYPISAEVISAIPSAFGAICLNQAGLDLFTATNPIPRYLRLLLDMDPLVRAAFFERDMPNVVGGAIDELVRHHPSLKESSMLTVLEIMKEVLAVGKEEREEEALLWRLRGLPLAAAAAGAVVGSSSGSSSEAKDVEMGEAGAAGDDPMVTSQLVVPVAAAAVASEEEGDKKESKVGWLVDVLARFLEGLFQNPTHSKEFVKFGGVELLIQIYSLPTLPVDFALSSAAGYSLLFLFRLLMDSCKEQVIPILQVALVAALKNVDAFVEWKGEGESWSLKFIDYTGASADVGVKGQEFFRAFINLECIIRLVADMFSSNHHSHSKSVQAVVTAFTGEKGDGIIPKLFALHQACLLETSVLKSHVPKSWYEMNPKKTASAGASVGTVGAGTSNLSRQASTMNIAGSFVDDAASDHHLDISAEEDPSYPNNDYRMMNTYYFKEFMTQIPTILSLMYQSVVRVLTTKTISNPSHRKPAQAVIEEIAVGVKGFLLWSRVSGISVTDPVKMMYTTAVIWVVEGLITDKRNAGSLQTSWVNAFDKTGGLQELLDLTVSLWESVCACLQEDLSTEEAKERVTGLIGLLEKCLYILGTLVDSKALLNSAFTFAIHGKENDKSGGDSFDQHDHLVSVRKRVLPIVSLLWESDKVNYFSSNKPGAGLWKPLMGMIMQILKAEGEVSTGSSGTARDLLGGGSGSGLGLGNPFAQLFGRGLGGGGAPPAPAAPVVADAGRVEQLIEMGYPRRAAETALIRCNNNFVRAVDYILTHPTLISDALASQSSASSSGVAAASSGAAAVVAVATVDASVGGSGSGSGDNVAPDVAPVDPAASANTMPVDNDDDDEEMDEQAALAQAMAISMSADSEAPQPASAVADVASFSAEPASTPMDIIADAPAEVVSAMEEVAVFSSAPDKGKRKMVEKPNLEVLNELREEFTRKAVARCLDLAGRIDFITFDIKDLLCLIGKTDVSKVGPALFAKVSETLAASANGVDADDLNKLTLELHLMALMLNDSLFKKNQLHDVKLPFFEEMAKYFTSSAEAFSADVSVPKWLSSAILIVEIAISEWDDKSPKFKDASSSLSSSNGAEKTASLLAPVIRLLNVESLDSDSLHAALRVLVRLTRSRVLALEFAERDGLRLLFKTGRLGEFPAQLSLISVILRHLVESKSVLAKSMEQEITNWFKNARAKDINSFMKGNAPLVCRNPEVFSQVVLALCHLPNYDPKHRSPQVALKPKANTELLSELTAPQSDGKDLAKDVVAFLINELLETKNAVLVHSGEDKAAEEKTARVLHFRRGYLIQTLSELIGSFNICKSHVAAFTRGPAKATSTPGNKQSARHPLLNFLLTDLLPLSVSEDAKAPASKRKEMESAWSVALITQLCTGPSASDDKPLNEQHQSTCKTVVDSLSRSIKDALASSESAEHRYGRFFGLADLVLQILTIRYLPQMAKIPASQNPILSATKCMLEKGFVNTLTQVLAEIDPFHPKSKTLTTAVLKPLETLTKMAVKIAKLPVTADKQTPSSKKALSSKMVVDAESSDFHSSDEEGDQDPAGLGESENEEISNIYRNSALGMYHTNPEDVDMGDVSDSEDGDDEGEEFEEFSDDDEFSGEDDEADDDDNSDPEDDMEIVVPQPYHGAHDEFDSTDNEGGEIGDTDAEMADEDDDGFTDDDGAEGEIAIVGGEEAEDEDEDDQDEDDQEDEGEDNGEEAEDEGGEVFNGEDGSEEDEDDLVIPFDENDGQLSEEGAGNDRNRRRRYIWDSVAEGFEGGDLFDRPIPINRPPLPQEEAHPLLVNTHQQSIPAASTGAAHQRGVGSAGGRGAILNNQMDWHSFIQTLAGPQAIQQIQQMERNGQAFRIEIQSNGQPIGDIRDLFRRGGGDPAVASELLLQGNEANPEDRPLTALHTAVIQTSQQRWVYEARLLFGAEYADVSLGVVESVLALLTPAALEERKIKEKEEAERKVKEEEERRIAEEKRKAEEAEAARIKAEEEEKERIRKEAEEAEKREREEQERIAREAEERERDAVAAAATTATAMDVVPADARVSELAAEPVPTPVEVTPAAVAPPARIMVEIGGRQVDITDPEFLAALPDDLRQEVLNQHLQEQQQRTAVAPVMQDNPDMSEFLNALPPDIRNEVLQQQRRPAGGSTRPAAMPAGAEGDPNAFLAALNRQAAMMDQGVLGGLPAGMISEANAAMRSMARLRQNMSQLSQRARGFEDSPSTPPSKVLKKSTRDVVQLVEKPALFTLLRLLFVPEPANKETLNRLLLNLCENSKSRLDLISMFLSILWDGNADFVLLDKNFSQLSIKGKGKQAATPKKVVTTNSQPFEAIPNLIVQRCLETLIFLVGSNDQIVVFFLHENEQFASTFGKYRPQSKKGKGKEKVVSNIYPVVVLLSLVERPIFLSNPVLLEQLVQLLTFVLRPISSLGAKSKDAATIGQTPAAPNPPADGSGSAPAPVEAGSAQSDRPPAVPVGAELAEDVLKVPMIPDQYVRAIVQVLTVGECSIKTFQYTLSMIQHLAPLNNNREIITNELISHSQSLGNSIIADLNDVASMLSTNKNDVDVNSGPLAKFSTAASQQAKFLRVLKTLDYIHSKLQQSIKEKEKDAAKAKAVATVNSGTAMDVEAEPSSSSSKTEPLIEENLTAIYNKIDVAGLWHALGNVMAVVSENDELTRVGTVLLPLIEAFMVISKPFVSHKANPSSSGIPRLTHSSSVISFSQLKGKDTRQFSHEELFNSFTEEHKKILNVMVRNNPSLMSGSFSLLVQNPKVLEFDNKRTYFSQQLHKKSAHVHYGSLPLNVRRAQVFEDSYHQLHGRSGEEIKYGKLNIRFHDEEGVDAGGVTREFFQVLARQMFNPDYALFKPSAVDKVTYQPNHASWINPDHLLYFRFVGRIIGKAIYDGRLLDAYFTRSFYKCMLEIPVDWKDMEAIDPSFHKSLQWILENDITDIMDLTFSTEVDDFGVERIIDLKPNGRNIEVTEETKQEYVSLITEQKLTKAIQQQIDAFLGGFQDVIPKDLIKIFNEQELELLISGLPDIDIDDMKNNTEYQNYTQSSPQIQWFWRAVRSFSQEERAKLIQFATGTSKVPLEGFKALEGSNGVQKFQIHKDFASKLRLPSAHTW
ncbi:UNVERIFIED_CONTAM: hypothetical protein HDU68_005895 [Siphonaria sp. JEL0065]|nr:hypothetical protein HDU68_005895 [Siphonaria sp. JEL0065]